MSGSWSHLAGRFAWSLTASPLTDDERSEVRSLLDSEPLVEIFFAQPATDQRHGLDSARRVRAGGGGPEMIEAALVHDVGKRHAGLGTVGRTIATASGRIGIPLSTRSRSYLEHGPVGAAELASAGAGALAVEFARSHHGARPGAIPQSDWDLLVAADSVVFGHRPASG